MPNDNHVPSLSRFIDLVEYFAAARVPATLTTLARVLNIPKSSCASILATLEDRGYLAEVGPRMGYYPTRRFHDAFGIIAQADPVRDRTRIMMERLAEETGETILLGRRDRLTVVYADVIESRESIRYSARVGQARPLHSTASGKSILARLAEPERRRLIEQSLRESPAGRIDQRVDRLERDIVLGETRGWQITDGETEPEVIGVGTSFFVGGEVFAISVGGPAFRMRDRIAKIGLLVRDAVKGAS